MKEDAGMKFRLFLGLVAVSVAACAAAPKYVFLFIGDGMSTPQRMVAEEFSRATGTGPLAITVVDGAGAPVKGKAYLSGGVLKFDTTTGTALILR